MDDVVWYCCVRADGAGSSRWFRLAPEKAARMAGRPYISIHRDETVNIVTDEDHEWIWMTFLVNGETREALD